jgi:Cd2+/Zn2+-exporting ATPase
MNDCCNDKNVTAEKLPEKLPSNIPLGASVQFKIHGMDCAEEVAVLKREVGPLVGGIDLLGFDVLNGKMTIFSPPERLDKEKIIKAISKTGMKAKKISEGSSQDVHDARKSKIILTAISGLFVLAGFVAHVWLSGSVSASLDQENHTSGHVPLISIIFYALATLAGSWHVLPKAWFAAKRLRPDMNLLMTVAVVGAIFIGEWFEGATVAFLFSLSLALESWSVGRARKAVQALMDLTSPKVTLQKEDGKEEDVALETVSIGSKFVVKPGERIPLDGRIIRGTSEINQAPITGESAAVRKAPGDDVFAGTINGDVSIIVESTKSPSDTTLAHIIKMVDEAQSRRAPSEQWVEKFARIYTPIVMGLAICVALIPPVLFQEDWSVWIYRALVLLVIACPCALVISTPVSIVAALAAAARNGILVKGGVYLEVPAALKAIAFDKTGTLTTGKLSVSEVVPMNGHDDKELLTIAAALENQSTHPIAKAIIAFAKTKNVDIKSATNFEIIQGKGAKGEIDGEDYWLGSHRYLEERGEETSEVHNKLEVLSRSGKTVVVIGNQKHVCGFIGLGDQLRSNARETIEGLRREGVGRIVMLTGDNKGTAEVISRKAGVDEVQAELLPGDKVTAIENLMSRFKDVAMVGDGINDAPAMGRASLGIAMGAAGSDAAIETADIALMSDDLSKLSWLITHSRRTLKVIRQNIIFSLSIKAVFVGLSFTKYASLWAAIAADMGASLLVVFNGLRLLKARASENKRGAAI